MKRIAIILAAAMLAAACSSKSDVDAGPDRACDPALEDALGAWAEVGFSGTVAIGDGGGLDCRAAFGLADAEVGTVNTEDTVFGIGSISKAFTAAAVLDLVDAGRVRARRQRRATSCPVWAGPPPTPPSSSCCCTRAASKAPWRGPPSRSTATRPSRPSAPWSSAFEPGTDFFYSNAGYSLLALIVDEQSGSSYREYLDEAILAIAGGHAGGFWDGDPAPSGPRAVGYTSTGALAGDRRLRRAALGDGRATATWR